ncbi:MAG: ubiquitin-activating E1 FCCH domain-containing protein [Desulfuromonadales bacterium]|nr:ubiquitin-activating E1 FCCH domain-containing protein [Desulfuromonadales bacterium]
MNNPVAVSQPSFTTGELSPSLYGRIDLARYYTALKTCRNWIVRPYGGVMNRSGSYFAASVKDHARKTRLIDFQVSTSQTYALEFGHQTLRFFSDGALVVYPDGHESEGEPVELATPWGEDDIFTLKVTQSADVMTICHPDYATRQLSRFSHTSWTLTEFAYRNGPFRPMNIDEALTVRTNGVTGTVTITASDDLFTAEMVGLLMRIEQAADTETKRWEVQKTIALNDIRRAGVGYYQALSAGTTGTVRPSTLEGSENDGDLGVVWLYLHSGFGIVEITEYVSATEVTATVKVRLPDSVVTGAQSRPITGATSFDPDYDPEFNLPPSGDEYVDVTCSGHGFSNGDTVTISAVEGMTDLNGTWVITLVDANTFRVFLYTDQLYISGGLASETLGAKETYKWALGAWGGDRGYPTTTTYHQQRQVFGGTDVQPQTVWESAVSGYLDFGQSNPILDDDAITFDLASRRVNEIRHFVPLRELVALTSEGAWMIKKDPNSLIPEANFQGRGGASHIAPVVVGSRALFVQEKGGAIRSLGYFFESDSYEGRDLTLTAAHLLFGKTVVDWAYQETPFNCVWIVTDDGQLLGLTYMPDQEVIGWHRHDTDGYFESVCCLSEGGEDALYAVVRREIGGQTKRYVERFTDRFFTDIREAVFVDSALTYDGRGAGDVSFTLSTSGGWTYQDTLTFSTAFPAFSGASDEGDVIVLYDDEGEALRLTIITYVSPSQVLVLPNRTVPEECKTGTSFDVARDTFTGLSHLEGKTVSVFADGNVAPQQTVSGGEISLSTPAVVVHAGLPIEADLETLDINAQGQTLQDKWKNIGSVQLIVEKTRGLFIGPDADHLLEVKPEMSGYYDSPVTEMTGPLEMNVLSDWSRGGRIFIRQSDPLPATILAAIPQVVVS